MPQRTAEHASEDDHPDAELAQYQNTSLIGLVGSGSVTAMMTATVRSAFCV